MFVGSLFCPSCYRVMEEREIIQNRMKAVEALLEILHFENLSAWQRALGRVLNIGPSELNLLFAIKLCAQYCKENERDIEDMSFKALQTSLSKILEKLKLGHLEMLVLVVSNLPFHQIERLFCYSIPSSHTQFDDTYIPQGLLLQINLHPMEQIFLLKFFLFIF